MYIETSAYNFLYKKKEKNNTPEKSHYFSQEGHFLI